MKDGLNLTSNHNIESDLIVLILTQRAGEVAPCDVTSFSQCVQKQENEEKGDHEIDAEWIIPWSDIEVGEPITHGGSCTINR